MAIIVTLCKSESVCVVLAEYQGCQEASTHNPPKPNTAHSKVLWDIGICEFHTCKIGRNKRIASVMIWGIKAPRATAR